VLTWRFGDKDSLGKVVFLLSNKDRGGCAFSEVPLRCTPATWVKGNKMCHLLKRFFWNFFGTKGWEPCTNHFQKYPEMKSIVLICYIIHNASCDTDLILKYLWTTQKTTSYLCELFGRKITFWHIEIKTYMIACCNKTSWLFQKSSSKDGKINLNRKILK
jgi:hypothetical protein